MRSSQYDQLTLALGLQQQAVEVAGRGGLPAWIEAARLESQALVLLDGLGFSLGSGGPSPTVRRLAACGRRRVAELRRCLAASAGGGASARLAS